MKTPNENRVHGLGIFILVLVNITGNPLLTNTVLPNYFLIWLGLIALIAGQWTGIVWSVRRSWSRFPELGQVKERLLYSFLISIFWVMSLMVVSDLAAKHFLNTIHSVFSPGNLFSNFFNGSILCFTVIGATEAVYYYTRLRRSEMERAALQRSNLLTQYDSLKQQVNPHFLFNSLNSLSSLISVDPERAEKFVEEMSHVYRYLLQSNREELVPLRQELAFIRSYLHLLKTRFGESLQVEIETPEASLAFKIPPLTLQLLLENAVKHNEISSENPLYIRIRLSEEQRLQVVNNLQKKLVTMPSERVGLANIMAKYRLLGQPEVEVEETETEFVVSLPLIG